MKKLATLLCSLVLVLCLTSCSVLLPDMDGIIDLLDSSLFSEADKDDTYIPEASSYEDVKNDDTLQIDQDDQDGQDEQNNQNNQNTQDTPSNSNDNDTTETTTNEIDYVKLINTITTDTIKACVNIRTEIRTYTSTATNLGSGVIFYGEEIKNGNTVIGYHYYVLTNYHVVELPSDWINCSFTVSIYQGNEYNATATNDWIYDDDKIELCKKNDLAILEFECATELKVIESETENPVVNETLISIGQPNGQHNAITIGTVEKYTNIMMSDGLNMNNVLVHNSPIDHGNSGGAIINTDHKLIGINFAGLFETNGNFKCGYGIPIETVFKFIDDFDTELYASLMQVPNAA